MYLNQVQTEPASQLQAQARYTAPIFLFCLALNIPFLLPWHSLPFPSFSSELAAYVLGTMSVLALLWAHRQKSSARLPRNILAPIFFIFIVLFQWGAGYFVYASTAILMVMVGSFLLILMAAGATLKSALGLEYVLKMFAQSVLIGGLLSALIGFVQASGSAENFAGLIASPMIDAGVYGNIAQQNHFATYLAFGLASAIYLNLVRQLSLKTTLFVSTILSIGLFLSASRSVYLYFSLIVLVMLWQRLSAWAKGCNQARGRYAIFALIISIAILVTLASHGAFMPQLKRLLNLTESVGARVFLWKHSIDMLQDAPLFGVGLDAFAWRLTEQIGAGSVSNSWGVDQFAHNVILQLLATTGVIGFCLVSGPIVSTIPWQRWRQNSPHGQYIAAVLLILLVHSLLEQPLYFTYFSIYAAIFLSFSDDKAWAISWGRLPSAGGCIVLVSCSAFVVDIAYQYRQFEIIFNQDSTLLQRSEETKLRLQQLHQVQVLQPLLEGYAPELFVSHEAPAEAKLNLNQRLIRFAPLPENMYRQAALLAENGQGDTAQYQVRKAILVYPDLAPAYLERFRLLAQENPKIYAQLAMFTEQEIDLYTRKP